jgi:hypothetical protein
VAQIPSNNMQINSSFLCQGICQNELDCRLPLRRKTPLRASVGTCFLLLEYISTLPIVFSRNFLIDENLFCRYGSNKQLANAHAQRSFSLLGFSSAVSVSPHSSLSLQKFRLSLLLSQVKFRQVTQGSLDRRRMLRARNERNTTQRDR